LDSDQGFAPEDDQRAFVLLWKHDQPCAVWMSANISVLDNEDGFRPFHDEQSSGFA